MPTYEYVCTDCGDDLEVVQSIHADSLTICPSCGGRLRKVFGNVGVVFKGSGFYKTDSRADAKRAQRSRDDRGKDKSGAKTDTAAGDGDKTSGPKADKADKADKASGSDKSGAGKSTGTDSGGGAAKGDKPNKHGGHGAKGSKSGHK